MEIFVFGAKKAFKIAKNVVSKSYNMEIRSLAKSYNMEKKVWSHGGSYQSTTMKVGHVTL